MADADLLREQMAYYEAIAPEYELHTIDAPGQDELLQAFAGFDICGDVLELACGPGNWTTQIVPRTTTLTAVDGSPSMLERARQRVASDHATAAVAFVQADIFRWMPEQRFDAVFFGFWLSHVPAERFDAFWAMLARCLRKGGKVFFVDDNHRSKEELVYGHASSVVERRLLDGTPFRVVKVPEQATTLEAKLRMLGWDVAVSASGDFYWGQGTPP